MKTAKFLLVTIALIMASTAGADAQGWLQNLGKKAAKRAEERAKQKVEDKVDKATDKAVDGAFDKAEDAVKGDGNDNNQQQQAPLPAVAPSPAPTSNFAPAGTGVQTAAGQTPQQLIDRCPAFPSLDYLMAIYDGVAIYDEQRKADAWQAIETFNREIDALRQQGRDIAKEQKAAWVPGARKDGEALAERTAQQAVGRSVEELQNMSDVELQAMSNDIVAQRMAGNVQSAPAVAPQQHAGTAQIETALKQITDRWAAINRQNQQEATDAQAHFKAVYERYRPVLNEKKAIIAKFFEGSESEGDINPRYTKQTVRRAQERIASKMADVPEYDRLTAQKMSATGISTHGMPTLGYDIAEEYFDATRSVTNPPIHRE